jgi:gliding motility-associated-like protein
VNYLWSDGTPTALVVATQGTYAVTVTDVNNCSATASETITAVGPSVTITSTDPSCGISNGQATANAAGSTSYTYSWSNSGNIATISNLAAGSYAVTVTDNQSCTATASVTLSSSGSPTLNFTSSDPSCNQSADGTITLIASGGSGGYTYTWSPGVSNNAFANGLTAGTYDVTVYDINNCSGTNSITLNEPAAINAIASSTDANCGVADGSVSVAASGGTGSLSYLWSTGDNATVVNNLADGFYSVTITDASLCSVVRNATIGIVLSSPVYGFKMPDTLLCEGASFTLSAQQPNAVSYQWSTGETTAQITVNKAGSYNVLVSGACNSVTETAVIRYESCDCDVAAPSAFTPNGDGNNDEFGAIFNCYEIGSFELRVFNRWGEKVFETKDKNGMWDGKYRGEPQPLQTYVYYLSAESIENGKSRMISKVGSVTLIR